MPRIPTVTSEVRATSLRTNGALPQTQASGDDFGAQIGRAMGAVADGIDRLGAGVDAYMERKRNEKVANAVAQSDFTPTEMRIRNEVGPDGAGYYDRVREEYLSFIDTEADKIEDDMARTEYRNRMMQQLPSLSSRSATYEAGIAAENSKQQANASIMSLQNRVMSDPAQYADLVQQGFNVIDTRTDINATLREGMKAQLRNDMARMRFEGVLGSAKSVAELDAIAAELTTPASRGRANPNAVDWQKEFSPADYTKMVNDIGTARKAFITKADADARAAIDSLQDRANDVAALIPQEELDATRVLVRNSQNPITAARMARILRNEEIKKESKNATPAEVRARINANNGNPGVVYPGVPPRLSQAISQTVQKFDVSAAYLGNLAHREYGKYLKPKSVPGKPEFMPVAVHDGVDLRNIRSDVVDAAARAGERLGRPLSLNSGYRSQTKQNSIRNAPGKDPNRKTVAKSSKHTEGTAIDISTVGMTPQEIGAAVAALADEGFTGFGQYSTHIHADFRDAVPSSFAVKEDGSAYGGWTNLSPEIAAELSKRGWGAGKTSAELIRNGTVATADDIDYGRPTDVLGPDGKPATTAVGVGQITSGTFIEVMRRPGTAARMGLDISGMSDEQLLELRKDPDINIMATAAFAEYNKKAMQGALGRAPSDAEVYMAHFMGLGGATTFLTNYKNNPNAVAADLMPDAAKANKSVFYADGRALSVSEVYNRIAVSFDTSQTQVAFGDNEMRTKVLKNMETQLENDPVAYAKSTGTFTVTELDVEQGFATRGIEARSIADYYNIPLDQIKPFTEDEAANLTKTMRDGDADTALEVMTAIQAMGPETAKAAILQLGEKEPVYGFAAGLQANRGGYAASEIVRGQKRLEENPAIKDTIGATDRDLADAFTRATGGSLYEIAPDQRQAIQAAALAHYVETAVARGRAQSFDEKLYGASVQAVLGGSEQAPAIDEVNGEPTVLPPGLSGDDLESAFQNMSIDDWARMSPDGLPPRYVNGDIIAPDDLASEATLRAVGNGLYKVMMGDGQSAVTGEPGPNGRMRAYVFAPQEDQIKTLATAPAAAQTPQGTALSIDEQTRLREVYGVLHQFDENGRWIGPAGGVR